MQRCWKKFECLKSQTRGILEGGTTVLHIDAVSPIGYLVLILLLHSLVMDSDVQEALISHFI